MLLHFPIVLAVAGLPLTPDRVPNFSITRECGLEGGTQANQNHCKDDEKQALQQVQKGWPQFRTKDRQRCLEETTMDGTGSYVEYLTCLEMARDTRNAQGSNASSETVGRRQSPASEPRRLDLAAVRRGTKALSASDATRATACTDYRGQQQGCQL